MAPAGISSAGVAVTLVPEETAPGVASSRYGSVVFPLNEPDAPPPLGVPVQPVCPEAVHSVTVSGSEPVDGPVQVAGPEAEADTKVELAGSGMMVAMPWIDPTVAVMEPTASVVGTVCGAGVKVEVKLEPWVAVAGAAPVMVTDCWPYPPNTGTLKTTLRVVAAAPAGASVRTPRPATEITAAPAIASDVPRRLSRRQTVRSLCMSSALLGQCVT